jgi:hypothetical protein
MDPPLLLLFADCPLAAGGLRRLLPALPVGPQVASPGSCLRHRASVCASAAAAASAAHGLPDHASMAGVSESPLFFFARAVKLKEDTFFYEAMQARV